jgi:Tfp pilus assembly protein PilO
MAKAQKQQKPPDFFTKVAKLTKGAKAAILVAAVVAVFAAFYFLHYATWEQTIVALQSEVETLSKSLVTEQGSLNKHKSIDEFIKPVEFTHSYLSHFLTNDNDIDRLVQILSDLASQAGVKVNYFSPKQVVPKTDYAEIQFAMDFEAPFLNVLKFLYSLSQMDRIINITSVNMGTPAMVDNRMVMLKIRCLGSTYRVLNADDTKAAS